MKDVDICMITGDFNIDRNEGELPIEYLDDVPKIVQQFNLSKKSTFSEYQMIIQILSN